MAAVREERLAYVLRVDKALSFGPDKETWGSELSMWSGVYG